MTETFEPTHEQLVGFIERFITENASDIAAVLEATPDIIDDEGQEVGLAIHGTRVFVAERMTKEDDTELGFHSQETVVGKRARSAGDTGMAFGWIKKDQEGPKDKPTGHKGIMMAMNNYAHTIGKELHELFEK